MTDETQTIPASDVPPVTPTLVSAPAVAASPEPPPLSPVETALTDLNLGFMDAETTVADAKATHDRIHANLSSAQAAVINAANKAMNEVEGIYGGFIHDETVEFVHKLLKGAGLLELSMEEKVKAAEQFVKLKLNEYFIVQGKAFIMTGDKKIQEASSYINRLEKATINLYRDFRDENQARVTAELKLIKSIEIMTRSFWGRLKFAFTGK